MMSVQLGEKLKGKIWLIIFFLVLDIMIFDLNVSFDPIYIFKKYLLIISTVFT